MDIIEYKILKKMLSHQYIGGKHTSLENLRKGFERSRYGEVEKKIGELIREGYINRKPTSYGMEASLNPMRLEEVRKKLLEFLEK